MRTCKKRPPKRWSLLGENDLKAAFSVVRDRNKTLLCKTPSDGMTFTAEPCHDQRHMT